MARPSVWVALVMALLLGQAACLDNSRNGGSSCSPAMPALSVAQAISWSLSNANGSLAGLPASVPGYALQTLQEAGIIGDPLFRFNEVAYRWVAADTWTYSANLFNLTCASGSNTSQRGCGLAWTLSTHPQELLLVFEGLDTVADVYLGANRVLRASNFHRRHVADVAQLLNSSTSQQQELRVVLQPALQYSQEQYEAYPYEIPTNRAVGGFEHFNFLRKPASDWGWDWGPAFAASGIHGDVQLVALNTAWLKGMHVQTQMHAGGSATLFIELELWVPRNAGAVGTVEVSAEQLGVQQQQRVVLSSFAKAGPEEGAESRPGQEAAGGDVLVQLQRFLTYEVSIAGPVQLWWPAGYGSQPLYSITATFRPDGCSACTSAATGPPHGASATWAAAGEPTPPRSASARRSLSPYGCSSVSRAIGFRTVELVTAPLAEAFADIGPDGRGWKEQLREDGSVPSQLNESEAWQQLGQRIADARQDDTPNETLVGESMYLRVNGVPLYVRGANVIPFHVLPTRASRANLTRLLTAAKRANMNTIRIWGGGLYQQDWLYEWCDANGLLIWQEVMAACNPYPLTQELMREFSAELRFQIRRLASHPSIALWGGNNEVEASFDWFEVTGTDKGGRAYAADFLQLFSQALRDVVLQLDPGRPYVDTSPSNLLYSTQPYLRRWGDPQNPDYGDVHFYNYNDNCQNPSMYPRAKFVSEFGFQSFPSLQSLRPFALNSDLGPFTELSQSRQRHPNGDAELLAQLSRHFKVPPQWSGFDGSASLRHLKHWAYLTQVQQSLCYDTALSTWRRLMADPQSLTMGVLYWQLNDVWPGYSWSSVNYGGRWKPLHYVVRRVFAPVVATTVVSLNSIKVYVSSQLRIPTLAQLTLSLMPLMPAHAAAPNATAAANGTASCSAAASERTLVATVPLQLPGLSVLSAWAGKVSNVMALRPGCTVTRCYLALEVKYRAVMQQQDAAVWQGQPAAGGVAGAGARAGAADQGTDQAADAAEAIDDQGVPPGVQQRPAAGQPQGGYVAGAPASVAGGANTSKVATYEDGEEEEEEEDGQGLQGVGAQASALPQVKDGAAGSQGAGTVTGASGPDPGTSVSGISVMESSGQGVTVARGVQLGVRGAAGAEAELAVADEGSAEPGTRKVGTKAAGKAGSGASWLGLDNMGAAPHRLSGVATGARLRARGLRGAGGSRAASQRQQAEAAKHDMGPSFVGGRATDRDGQSALLGAATLTPGLRSLGPRGAAPSVGLAERASAADTRQTRTIASGSPSIALTPASVGTALVGALPLLASNVRTSQGPGPSPAPGLAAQPLPAPRPDAGAAGKDEVAAAQLQQAMDSFAQRWTQALQATLPPPVAAATTAGPSPAETIPGLSTLAAAVLLEDATLELPAAAPYVAVADILLAATGSGQGDGSAEEQGHGVAALQLTMDAASGGVSGDRGRGAEEQQGRGSVEVQQALYAAADQVLLAMGSAAEVASTARAAANGGSGAAVATAVGVDSAARRPDAVPRMALEKSASDASQLGQGQAPGQAGGVADAGLAPGVHESVSETFLSPFKQLQLQPVQVLVSDMRMASLHEACFHLRTAPPANVSPAHSSIPAAVLVVLEAGDLEGEFSDNLFTLEPCGRPKHVCFSNADAAATAGLEGAGVGEGALDLVAFRKSLAVVALNSEGSLWWESEDLQHFPQRAEGM